MVTVLFELPRLIYVSQGRATPAILALLVVWWFIRKGRREPPVTPADPSHADVRVQEIRQ